MSGHISIIDPGFESPLASVKASVGSKIERKEVSGLSFIAAYVILTAGFT